MYGSSNRGSDQVYLKAAPKVGLSNKVYTEPYRAIEKLSDVVFKIKRTAYRKVSREHVDRLKLEMLTNIYIDMMHKQVMESDM